MRWAGFEHILDSAIAVLFYQYGGREIADELPMGTKGKIKFFRKAALRVPQFQQTALSIERIATEALRVLKERNWCIHRAALAFYDTDTVAYPVELVRLVRPHLFEEERRSVTIDHIKAVADDCAALLFVVALFHYEPLGVTPKNMSRSNSAVSA